MCKAILTMTLTIIFLMAFCACAFAQEPVEFAEEFDLNEYSNCEDNSEETDSHVYESEETSMPDKAEKEPSAEDTIISNIEDNEIIWESDDLNGASDTENKSDDTALQEEDYKPNDDEENQKEEIIKEEDNQAEDIPASEESEAEEKKEVKEDAASVETVQEGKAEINLNESSNYYLTISTLDGNSIDVSGGQKTYFADILRQLGHEILDSTVIEIDMDSVDTNVINVVFDNDGKPSLMDNGHFEKASKNLVVYVDGVAVELVIVDDNDFYVDATSGNDDTNSGGKTDPFKTISKAIEKAKTDKTKITLLTDISEEIVIGKNQKIILDLNDKELKGLGIGSVITVLGELTIEDSNPITERGFVTGGVITGGIGTQNGNFRCGGGIYLKGGNLTINGGTVYSNKLNGKGGGIYIESGNLILSGGNIVGNVVIGENNQTSEENKGGGIYLNSGSVSILNGSITSNCAGNGGAIFAETGNVIIYDGLIQGNTVDYSAGGVYIENASLVILGGNIINNTAQKPEKPDGIELSSDGSIKIAGGIFGTGEDFDKEKTYFENNHWIAEGCKVIRYKPDPEINFLKIEGEKVYSPDKNKCYSSITDALTENVSILFLQTDIQENVNVSSSTNISLKLNKKTLTGDISVEGIFKLEDPGRIKGKLMVSSASAKIDADFSKFSSVSLTGGCYSKDPTEYLGMEYTVIETSDNIYKYKVAKKNAETPSYYNAVIIESTDENCIAYLEISGTVAKIIFKDKNGSLVNPQNMSVRNPYNLILMGAKTLEIRLTESFTLVLDIQACMCEKTDCIISMEIIDGVIYLYNDGVLIFKADVNDIINNLSRLEYDGKTLKAYDDKGNLLKKFTVK